MVDHMNVLHFFGEVEKGTEMDNVIQRGNSHKVYGKGGLC